MEAEHGLARPVDARAAAPFQFNHPIAATDRRRSSEVSIGRIDVQVNNTPAQEPARAPVTSKAYHTSFLDTSYLGRFFLRP
jgi:hypothetical protein